MEIKWSDAQLDAIESRGEDLLVSAAAGSGKTAVLAQRIVRILTDKQNPVDPSRLLILTYTRAAASQMRERIGEGLDKQIRQDPENRLLRRQRLLLETARISTIHSLCSDLIQTHFDVLDIDPSYRMADENELKILQADVAADVLETWYASGNAAFKRFADAYAPEKNDGMIAEWILRIYEASRSCPSPQWWLKKCLAWYEIPEGGMNEHILVRDVVESTRESLRQDLRLLQEGILICRQSGFLPHYLAQLQDVQEILSKALAQEEYDTLRGSVLSITLSPASRKKQADADPQQRDRVKLLYDRVREDIKSVKNGILAESMAGLEQELIFLAPFVQMLTQLVQDFSDRIREEKRDRNMLDFGDLEHFALDLLAEHYEDEQGHLAFKPTAIADELAAWYQEVVCDEYQDSNRVQETILEALSSSRLDVHDRFMVGDVKQSIYRFRQADAAIFLEKYHSYPQTPGCRRIILDQNFRSRKTVLDGVNAVFRRLMRPEMGGIDYDENSALKAGASFPEPEADTDPAAGTGTAQLAYTDVLLAGRDELPDDMSGEMSAAQLEAAIIAHEIRRITDPVQGLSIYDRDADAYRTARFGDIAVLLRSVKGYADEMVNVLTARDIPARAQLSVGFFSSPEIQIMTSLLAVIDNPRQDIPLAAVLHSPIVGMTSEEMALIRAAHKEGNLYDAVVDAAGHVRNTSEIEDKAAEAMQSLKSGARKAAVFIDLLSSLRLASAYLCTDELIEYAFEATGYYDYASSMPAGVRRKANLDMLLERARAYMASGRSALFGFMRYLEQIRDNEIDFGLAGENADAGECVSILSVHKSKGLEYPVVILAGLGRQMNKMDMRAPLVLHPQYGIGINVADGQTRRKMPGRYRAFLADRLAQEGMAEELRILYVAMTRAKEKLILTGTVKKMEKGLERWHSLQMDDLGRMSVPDMIDANSFLDLLMPCLFDMGSSTKLEELYHLGGTADRKDSAQEAGLFHIRTIAPLSLLDSEVEAAVESKQGYEQLKEERSGIYWDQMETDAGWTYPWAGQISMRGNYTVSELKKLPAVPRMPEEADEEESELLFADAAVQEMGTELEEAEAVIPPLPSFMQEEEVLQKDKGAFYGTAFHRAMELLDFKNVPSAGLGEDFVSGELLRMTQSGRLEEAQAKTIHKADILQLLESPLGTELVQAAGAGTLHRESQFVMSVPADKIRPLGDASGRSVTIRSQDDLNGESAEAGEVIVQGVIDAWYEKDGDIVLIDYKTDHVPKGTGAQILTERYQRQLDYYQMALEEASGRKVVGRYIYSTSLAKMIEL